MSNTGWNVIPNVSVNGLDFGIERTAVRKVLGKPKKVFRKTSSSENTTDAYADFHVYYSPEDQLEAIELFGSNISLSINSQPVYPGTLSSARKILPDLEDCYGSYISKEASIGISAEEGSIVSILVGRKNYYS